MIRSGETCRHWLRGRRAPGSGAPAADRRRLIAFAHDLPNSEQASHRLNFLAFAPAPAYTRSAALYRNFDRGGPLAPVRDMVGLGEALQGGCPRKLADSAISRWFGLTSDTNKPQPTR